jgi:hypothetical protein
MERLKAGASFRDLAAGYRDPSRRRGGAWASIPLSKLKQAAPALRDAVLNKAPGAVKRGERRGRVLVLVVAHEQAGQRDLSTPGVRDASRRRSRRGRATAPHGLPHLDSKRRVSLVNYEARRVVEVRWQRRRHRRRF